ncbi:hypothetical protein TUM20983_37310 [Mycobacterium antarcticum]|nr:hypothetical protein TUM20983_37310 [Mycolicibacterium sp. TUM20983]
MTITPGRMPGTDPPALVVLCFEDADGEPKFFGGGGGGESGGAGTDDDYVAVRVVRHAWSCSRISWSSAISTLWAKVWAAARAPRIISGG